MPLQRAKVNRIGLQWNDDEVILRYAEHRAFDLLDSDEPIWQAGDRNFSAHGIARRKKVGGDVCADIGHARRALILGICKEASIGDIAIVDLGRICRGANYENILEHLIVALDFRRCAACLGSNLADERRMLFQVIVVFQRQLFITALGGRDGVGILEVLERVEALNRK